MASRPSLVAELSCTPVGTGSTSTSELVAAAVKAIRNTKGVKCMVTPMATVIEAEGFEALFEAIRAAHEAMAGAGARRVISHIKIDDRRDKRRSAQDMVAAVQRHLGEP